MDSSGMLRLGNPDFPTEICADQIWSAEIQVRCGFSVRKK